MTFEEWVGHKYGDFDSFEYSLYEEMYKEQLTTQQILNFMEEAYEAGRESERQRLR